MDRLKIKEAEDSHEPFNSTVNRCGEALEDGKQLILRFQKVADKQEDIQLHVLTRASDHTGTNYNNNCLKFLNLRTKNNNNNNFGLSLNIFKNIYFTFHRIVF